MSEAETYMRKAAECREQSSKCLYPSDKASWLHLAAQWTKRAQKCDAPALSPLPGASNFIGRFFSEK